MEKGFWKYLYFAPYSNHLLIAKLGLLKCPASGGTWARPVPLIVGIKLQCRQPAVTPETCFF